MSNIDITISVAKKEAIIPSQCYKDGLILQVRNVIQNKEQQQKTRFIHAHFDCTGSTLAAGDQLGNIFIIDLLRNQFRVFTTTYPCTALRYSKLNNNELFMAATNGNVFIINIDLCKASGELLSHKQAVTDICFSHDYLCLTSSKYEAIVWDLRSNTRIQVLDIKAENQLRLIMFMPITSNILACFEDNTTAIWKCNSFELLKEILPQSNGKRLKSIACTRNGRVMVFSGYFSYLSIFSLDTWTEINSISFPQDITAIKRIDFIPCPFDGGSNKMLGILASNGKFYFYDMELYKTVNKVVVEEEITKFDCSPSGKHIACILKCGEINIYKIAHYLPSGTSLDKVREKSTKTCSPRKISTKRKNASLLSVQKQIKEVLDINKLQAILNQFGRYPDLYRLKIWAHLLDLPNNTQQYNTFINISLQLSFEDIEQAYPLVNKMLLKNLKRLLTNLVTWSPFFAQVSYLPVFVFPFVKVFHNEPVLCFEAVCAIIVNWCQYWFQYFPLPPINILGMVENLLLEHDPDLLKLFAVLNINSKVYAWPLLESAFSEVLPPQDWLQLWDHVLTNEPAFLLMCVCAYNILQRQTISKLNSEQEFELFYHNPNVIDIKNLISKSYNLLSKTNERNHPQQYLQPFTKIKSGSYPHFLGFPKIFVDVGYQEMTNLKREELEIITEEKEILIQKETEFNEINTLLKDEEEKNRLRELEKVCRQKVCDERKHVREQRERLLNLRKKLHQEETAILNRSREKIIEKNINEKRMTLEKILNEVEQVRTAEELEVAKAESGLIKHYTELLHQKIHLEEAFNSKEFSKTPIKEYKILTEQKQLVANEIAKMHKESQPNTNLKQLNVTTSIDALDNLIMLIEMELAKHPPKDDSDSKSISKVKVLKLESETRELELEVSKLLSLLADIKARETKDKLNKSYDKIKDKDCVIQPSQNYRYTRQQAAFKNNVKSTSVLENEFSKLKQLIQQSQTENNLTLFSNNPTLTDGVSEELATINY